MIYPSLGDSWVPQFLSRYSTLQTTISRLIESARVKEVSSEAIMRFFCVFCLILEEKQIPVENVYNMDETGMSILDFVDDRFYSQRKSS